MSTRSPASRIKAVIRHLFGLSRRNVTYTNHKELYYKHYWFPKNICNGIEFVADFERCSKKDAAVRLVEDGLSRWMGDKIKEQIAIDKIARERNEKARRTRFQFLIRKYARQHGLDVKDIF